MYNFQSFHIQYNVQLHTNNNFIFQCFSVLFGVVLF